MVLISKTLVASEPPPGARVPRLHRPLPAPGLIAAYALRLWNRPRPKPRCLLARCVGPRRGDARPGSRGLHGGAGLQGTPRDSGDRPGATGRLKPAPGGWRGRVTYRAAGPRLARLLDKLLALANALGLGRSRGIGLGDTHAQWIKIYYDNNKLM